MIFGTLLARIKVGRGGGGAGCLAKVFGQFCARNLICLGDTLATLERTPRVAFQKCVAFWKTFAKSWHSIAKPTRVVYGLTYSWLGVEFSGQERGVVKIYDRGSTRQMFAERVPCQTG